MLPEEAFHRKGQADCKLLREKRLNDSFYKEPMGEGESFASSNEPDKNWSYPPPNTSKEQILKRVCSQ